MTTERGETKYDRGWVTAAVRKYFAGKGTKCPDCNATPEPWQDDSQPCCPAGGHVFVHVEHQPTCPTGETFTASIHFS